MIITFFSLCLNRVINYFYLFRNNKKIKILCVCIKIYTGLSIKGESNRLFKSIKKIFN